MEESAGNDGLWSQEEILPKLRIYQEQLIGRCRIPASYQNDLIWNRPSIRLVMLAMDFWLWLCYKLKAVVAARLAKLSQKVLNLGSLCF